MDRDEFLGDFGLATAVGTVHDLRSGTPADRASEPMTGREVTARSDRFAPGGVPPALS
jgi:hypothetical protein